MTALQKTRSFQGTFGNFKFFERLDKSILENRVDSEYRLKMMKFCSHVQNTFLKASQITDYGFRETVCSLLKRDLLDSLIHYENDPFYSTMCNFVVTKYKITIRRN